MTTIPPIICMPNAEHTRWNILRGEGNAGGGIHFVIDDVDPDDDDYDDGGSSQTK